MSRRTSDYIALAIISRVEWEEPSFSFEDDSKGGYKVSWTEPGFSGDMNQLKKFTESRCGFSVSDVLLSEVMRALAECGLIRVTDDDYSGTFVKIKPSEFGKFIERSHNERAQAINDNNEAAILSHPSDYPNAAALIAHELFEDYHELGDEWLKKALEGLKGKIESDGKFPLSQDGYSVSGTSTVPASDRIVSLSDNQQSELEGASSELIAEVEKSNGIDGDPTFRQIVLGQLKAGRELIRAQIFNAELMRLIMMDALKSLINKYDGHVIGAAAATLMELLIKHVVGAD